LFLAVAATGAPLDRITIILGALSVGVGLGLQALVNNLVSGLIIAFEKPVNVGDSVEIGGRSGMIKSIGFRSSILSTVDGAEVIIPNGDLLNAHLVNWSLGNRMRRGDLLIGIAFGTDLEKARKILEQIMAADKRILRYPPSFVLFQQFNSSSIDVKLFFWSVLIDELGSIKSDLIAAIDQAFKENGIEIPYPQQELHIRNVDETKESIAGNSDYGK
jgi:potassium efflux system protein